MAELPVLEPPLLEPPELLPPVELPVLVCPPVELPLEADVLPPVVAADPELVPVEAPAVDSRPVALPEAAALVEPALVPAPVEPFPLEVTLSDCVPAQPARAPSSKQRKNFRTVTPSLAPNLTESLARRKSKASGVAADLRLVRRVHDLIRPVRHPVPGNHRRRCQCRRHRNPQRELPAQPASRLGLLLSPRLRPLLRDDLLEARHLLVDGALRLDRQHLVHL